ncbi:cytochrome P450 [Halosegnis marinus]|uniref:cytochrome P450 n=1 Tax=Halosegnis marinus TaxID=3034023 RepID=UPI00361E4017
MSVPTVGPRDVPALVRAHAREDVVGVARVLRERHGHLVRIAVPRGPTAYLVTHPEDVERVLRSEPERFGYYTGDAASDFDRALGDTVVSLTEASGGWLERLRALAPEFRRASIEPKAPGLADAAAEAYAEHAGERVDSLRLARVASLRMLGRWLFGPDVRRHEEAVVEAVTTLRGAFKRRNLTVRGAVAGALGVGGDEADIEAAIGTLESVAAALVARRVASPDDYDDALATWLTRPDPVTGEPLAPATVEREAVGMVVAGFATLSAGLSWAIHALARRPELQARLAAEAERSALFGGEVEGSTADQLPSRTPSGARRYGSTRRSRCSAGRWRSRCGSAGTRSTPARWRSSAPT